MKEKLTPSEQISNEIHQLLQRGTDGEERDFMSELMVLGFKQIIQRFVEEEVKDYLGRDRYDRRQTDQKGYRNGYETKRFKMPDGSVNIAAPQVRGLESPYRSFLLDRLPQMSERLKTLVIEMYARGLSTRDIEETLRNEKGDLLISKSAVSNVTEALWEEYQTFAERDLSVYDVVYMFVDGVYESMRDSGGRKEAILAAWAICSDGRRRLLHLALGGKESEPACVAFFRDMIRRGLRAPLVITRDGAPGLQVAIERCFPQTKSQPCLAHKLRNVACKLPDSAPKEVMSQIKCSYYHSDPEVAKLLAQRVVEQYAKVYPSAIDCFQKDFDACIQYMQFPVGHHKYIRTTNLLERAFEEQKRRTKIIPRFFDETSCLKLVYATLIRASEKWQRVSMSDFDLTILRQIRALYGWKDEDGWISKKIAA